MQLQPGAELYTVAHPCAREMPASGATSSYDAGCYAPSTPMPDGLPSIVGRYRIVRSLGHGRLGALYVAEDVRIGRKAALRLLPMVSGELRTRLELELKSLARVQHSGLATIFDIGEHDGCLFFTRAFIQGRTLREIIAAKTSKYLA